MSFSISCHNAKWICVHLDLCDSLSLSHLNLHPMPFTTWHARFRPKFAWMAPCPGGFFVLQHVLWYTAAVFRQKSGSSFSCSIMFGHFGLLDVYAL